MNYFLNILFKDENIENKQLWEEGYVSIMDYKYRKNIRNFSKTITGKKTENPNIYVIPRCRGGPSYKKVNLEKDISENIQFCPISKGFSMQDVSSFSLGPVIGEGLCVVNSTFSKIIASKHIEGGGEINIKRKNLWKRSRKPHRQIEKINKDIMLVNGVEYNIKEWLNNNKNLWFEEWLKWSRLVALFHVGKFDWSDDSETISFSKKR